MAQEEIPFLGHGVNGLETDPREVIKRVWQPYGELPEVLSFETVVQGHVACCFDAQPVSVTAFDDEVNPFPVVDCVEGVVKLIQDEVLD